MWNVKNMRKRSLVGAGFLAVAALVSGLATPYAPTAQLGFWATPLDAAAPPEPSTCPYFPVPGSRCFPFDPKKSLPGAARR